jgi:plastocyanin
VVLRLEARNSLFSPASLSAPAGRSFRIAFSNADNLPHNVTIADGHGALHLNERPFMGPTSVTYVVPALPAGEYRLGCIVHPDMTGTLTAR